MKLTILAFILTLFFISTKGQDLIIHKTDGSVLKISISEIDSISFTTDVTNLDLFCNAIPSGWSCEILQTSFDTLPIPEGPDGRLEDPIAVISYSNDSLGCINSKSLYLYFYDISKKDKLEEIIINSQPFSWCIPIFFGETDSFYVITSPCYLSNGCWSAENLEPLYQAIKGLFSISIINAK